jgi:N-acetylneuraminic acid mutarotase
MSSVQMIVGGGGARFKRLKPAYVVMNPEWIGLTTLGVPRYGGAMLVYGGVLYVVGGVSRTGVTSSVEKVDLSTMQRSYGASMPEPRAHFAFGLVGTKLYVLGGVDRGGSPTNTIYAYDVPNNSWSTLSATLPKKIAYCGSAVLSNIVYVAGGIDDQGNILKDTYAFNPSNNTVTAKASMNTARQNHACASLGGKVYCFGGDDGSNPLQSIESYDPSANAWTQLTALLPKGVTGLTALPVTYEDKNYILLVGG